MNDLREAVIVAMIQGGVATIGELPTIPMRIAATTELADAAITAVIESLAAEAEELGLGVFSLDGETTLTFADWLRAHLDDGRDGEAGG